MPIQNMTFYNAAQNPNSKLYWLLRFRLGGDIVFNYAEDELYVPSTEHGTIHFKSRLKVHGNPSYSLEVTYESKSMKTGDISVSIEGSERLHLYRHEYALTGATVEYRLWCEGTNYEDSRIFDGIAKPTSWGGDATPFKMSITSYEPKIDKEFPDDMITPQTWPTAKEQHYGRKYPIVFGQPTRIPCCCIDTTTHAYVVAGHALYTPPQPLPAISEFQLYKDGNLVARTDYWQWGESGGEGDEALNPGSIITDSAGNVITVIYFKEDPGNSIITAQAKGFVSAYKAPGGIEYFVNDFVNMIYYLMVYYSNIESTDQIDENSFSRALLGLPGWSANLLPELVMIRSLFNGSGSNTTTVLKTITERLCRQVPLVCFWREGTYQALPLTWQKIRTQVVRHLRVGHDLIDCIKDPEFESIDNVINSYTILYDYMAYDTEGVYFGKRYYNPPLNVPVSSDLSDKVIETERLTRSEQRFGRREKGTIFCPDCSGVTAIRLGEWIALWWHNQQFTIGYKGTKKSQYVVPGDWVEITDERRGYYAKPFLCIYDSPSDTGCELRFRSAEDVLGESEIESLT